MALQIPKILRDEVKTRLGLDERVSGEQALIGAVSRCMNAAGIADVAEYSERLLKDRQLFDALIDELVVPESWFFRDGTPFQWLAEWARAWCRSSPGRPLRILSAPCAAGQEPYSVVITLLEAGLSADEFIVEGGDISERNLRQARNGVFKSYAFRGQRSDLRQRYFLPAGEGCYAMNESVRSLVTFRRLNLLQEPPPPAGHKYNVILCRNVLIYMTAEARQRVWSWLDASLTDDGIIFAGHADDMTEVSDRFGSAGRAGAFCFQRRRQSESPIAVPLRRSQKGDRPLLRRQADPTRSASALRAQPGRLKRNNHGMLSANEHVTPQQESATREFDAARGLADVGRTKEAAALCRAVVDAGRGDEDIYVLYASILGALGNPAEAERALRSALYLNPGNGEALLQLALLAERRGDPAEAGRLRRRLRP